MNLAEELKKGKRRLSLPALLSRAKQPVGERKDELPCGTQK